MTSRAGMHFPCCCERRDGEPSGKLNPIEEAVLRQFIRFGIPPEPRECAIRRTTYLQQLSDLNKRNALPQSATGALRDGEFKAEQRRLKAEARADILRIQSDPYSYRYWVPGKNDYRRLVICQAMWAHDTRLSDPDLLFPLPKKGRGRPSTGKMWTYSQFAKMAYRKLELEREEADADEQKLLDPPIEQAAVAAAAIELINESAKEGEWTGIIPEASTIEVSWKHLNVDVEGKDPPYPPAIQRLEDATAHLKSIENAADMLGMRRNLSPEYPEFARWAAAKLWVEENQDPQQQPWFEHRPPAYVCCWKTHRMWLSTVPSMGSREVKEGHASIAMPMLAEALAMGIAMLISADERQKTPRDIRLSGEHFGKLIGGFVAILHQNNDTTGDQLMDILGVEREKLN